MVRTIKLPLINGQIYTDYSPTIYQGYFTITQFNDRIDQFNTTSRLYIEGNFIKYILPVIILVGIPIVAKLTVDGYFFGIGCLIGIIGFFCINFINYVLRPRSQLSALMGLTQKFNREDNVKNINWKLNVVKETNEGDSLLYRVGTTMSVLQPVKLELFIELGTAAEPMFITPNINVIVHKNPSLRRATITTHNYGATLSGITASHHDTN
ncbi:3155_t:CDS:2, partial [Cetraspora pellucida]